MSHGRWCFGRVPRQQTPRWAPGMPIACPLSAATAAVAAAARRPTVEVDCAMRTEGARSCCRCADHRHGHGNGRFEDCSAGARALAGQGGAPRGGPLVCAPRSENRPVKLPTPHPTRLLRNRLVRHLAAGTT
eukprot:363411-Chlamydomonas_euryale.AAC.7